MTQVCGTMKRGDIMLLTVYEYPKCSTCQKAKKWLKENEVAFQPVHIVDNPPTKNELENLVKQSGLDIKKFFNTSGMKYRELGVKEKMKTATDDELLELLASDGMLIKRPIATDGNKVTVGFKEDQYEEVWKKQ
ncbi:arsenate reductase family protein [Fictibacillus nanhaiensis]|nr:arsenate reductase family protein [Fictibacillus nanhaiensis]